jgi:hypothetical protein
MDEQDVKSAGNTPVKEVYSELRDRAGIFKTSAILIGTFLNKIKMDKSYKEHGFKSFNDLINGIGLSIDMATSLMQITDVLEDRYPEAYRNLKDGVEGAYLPAQKAMYYASQTKPEDDDAGEFIKPAGIQKLKKMVNSEKLDENEGLPISKLANSSKAFTKKVMNCDTVPELTKSEMAVVNKKIQDLKETGNEDA